jgi:hypothetical protein
MVLLRQVKINKELIDISFTQYQLSSSERFILLVLCNFANSQTLEVCLPQKKIILITGLDKKTVSKCIQSLINQNILIYENKLSGLTNTSRIYKINICEQIKPNSLIKSNKRNLSQMKKLTTIIQLSKIYGYKCNYCHSVEDLELDHIISISKEGSNEFENLQLLCKPCNLIKSNN